METKIIAVVNKKGGVGKTATAQNFGCGLALHGHKTLLIDLDTQRDLTSYFFEGKDQMDTVENSSLEVLTGETTAKKAAIPVNVWLDLIPASKGLAIIEKYLNEPIGNEDRLKEALEPVLSDYDFIVIDTPRIMDLCTTNALVACTDVILTAECDEASIDAVEDTLEMIAKIKRLRNNKLNIDGILVTRYKGTSIQKRNYELLKEIAEKCNVKVFEQPIREGTAIQEARSMKQSIYEYAKASKQAKDYNALVMQFIDEE